jgi:virginiamycin B lyase
LGLRGAHRITLVGAIACIGALVAVAPAHAFIYWTNSNGTIGRANLNGTAIDESFITIPAAADGVRAPCGLAVSGTDVYWTNCNGGTATTLGSAALDGTGADNNFITGALNECGVAVEGSYLYWDGDANLNVGRALLNGSDVNENFLPAGSATCGIAVNGSYIYWADRNTNSIGRANLDGSGIDDDFITGAPNAGGVAIDGSYIYWGTSTSVGRANLDGSGIDENFIAGVAAPTQIAVYGPYVYWTTGAGTKIGRANLDGTGVDPDFITVTGALFGLAVDGLGPPVAGTSVNAAPISGAVLVKLPSQHAFTKLRAGETIPLGSTVNATSGVVSIASVENSRGQTGTGHFYDGIFRITQRRSANGLITDLRLVGPQPTGCTAHFVRLSVSGASTARKHPRVQLLWGDAHGNFATVGSYASAVERGTKWLTEDTCAGTLIHVTQGAVTIDDFPHHRTFILKAPHSFLAHPGAGG